MATFLSITSVGWCSCRQGLEGISELLIIGMLARQLKMQIDGELGYEQIGKRAGANLRARLQL